MTSISIEDLEFDRSKVLAWWTGRITNAELAEWTGQTERDVRLILDTPYFRSQISGGGRGSKTTRRISRKARNAVALVGGLRKAGMSIESAASLLNAVPVLASVPTPVVDFSPTALEGFAGPFGSHTHLAISDPDGGWHMTDIVPRHVCDRHCRPIVRNESPEQIPVGDIAWFPDYAEEINGGLPVGYQSLGEPIYRPEIDPLGIYELHNACPDNSDRLDTHIFIVDGRWVWIRYQDPGPRECMLDLFQKYEMRMEGRFDEVEISYRFNLIAEIDQKERTARSLRSIDEESPLAQRAWKQFQTKLDVNISLAVRQMKRRAYGLVSPDAAENVTSSTLARFFVPSWLS